MYCNYQFTVPCCIAITRLPSLSAWMRRHLQMSLERVFTYIRYIVSLYDVPSRATARFGKIKYVLLEANWKQNFPSNWLIGTINPHMWNSMALSSYIKMHLLQYIVLIIPRFSYKFFSKMCENRITIKPLHLKCFNLFYKIILKVLSHYLCSQIEYFRKIQWSHQCIN